MKCVLLTAIFLACSSGTNSVEFNLSTDSIKYSKDLFENCSDSKL